MQKAKITIHPDYKIGEIDRRLFGAFLEPIGSWIYGSIWNPRHPLADDMGFRRDILEMTKELGIPAIRMPGGNFTSGWEWKDSIGPKEERRTHLDLAWRQYETNEIGHDEYLEWARRVNTEPLYTLNMGTGSIEDALHCVEYTNHEGGTYWSDLRRKNGYEKPHKVKTWCLGNEMDGPWQIRSWEKDPKGYGIKVHEASKVVKWIDPECETIVAGSSTPNNRTYPDWDLQVLGECYESVDYLSLHYYHTAPEGNIGALMNASSVFEDFINTEIAACDVMQAHFRSSKKMMISFDEYGCNESPQKPTTVGRYGAVDRSTYPEFSTHISRPFRYNDPDRPEAAEPGRYLTSLALTSVLMTLMRHADRVKIGCMTCGLFVIGHDEEHVWKQAGYYMFEPFIKYASGVSLRPAVEAPVYSVEGYNLNDFNQTPAYENVPYMEACASFDAEKGNAAIFLINRNWEETLEVELDVSGFAGYRLAGHTVIAPEDPYAYNTYERQMITPYEAEDDRWENGRLTLTAPKLSFHVIHLTKCAGPGEEKKK